MNSVSLNRGEEESIGAWLKRISPFGNFGSKPEYDFPKKSHDMICELLNEFLKSEYINKQPISMEAVSHYLDEVMKKEYYKSIAKTLLQEKVEPTPSDLRDSVGNKINFDFDMHYRSIGLLFLYSVFNGLVEKNDIDIQSYVTELLDGRRGEIPTSIFIFPLQNVEKIDKYVAPINLLNKFLIVEIDPDGVDDLFSAATQDPFGNISRFDVSRNRYFIVWKGIDIDSESSKAKQILSKTIVWLRIYNSSPVGLGDPVVIPLVRQPVSSITIFMDDEVSVQQFRRTRLDVTKLHNILESDILVVDSLEEKKLELAVGRFNLALHRKRKEDQIIDFAIALESSILFGVRDELIFRLKVRAAKLISDSEIKNINVDIPKYLGILYKARSAIVHDGKLLESTWDKSFLCVYESKEKYLNEFVFDGFVVVGSLLRSLIKVLDKHDSIKDYWDDVDAWLFSFDTE